MLGLANAPAILDIEAIVRRCPFMDLEVDYLNGLLFEARIRSGAG